VATSSATGDPPIPHQGTRALRSRDLIEVILGYGLILAVIWTPNPLQRILYWTTLAAIIVITLLRRENLKTLGLGTTGLVSSLWIVGLALGLGGITVWVASQLHLLHSLFGQAPLIAHVWGYLLWALMQQFLLQSYFLARFLRLTSRPWQAVALSALLFSIAHIPNPVLVALTLIWGVISCVLFLRYRNLYTLGLAHCILGICIAITVPNHIHRHMRVGLGYLHYHQHRGSRLLP
jgi:membrane protease YdiL (CAAX protease family)